MIGQPSPYSDKGSAQRLALAGQCGMLWRQVKRQEEQLRQAYQEAAMYRDLWEKAGGGHGG